MYAEHVPKVSAHGKASPSGLADLCTFALLSIKVPFPRVPASMRDVRKHGERSGHLWGWKQPGYIAAHGDAGRALWERLRACTYSEDCIAAIIASVPGLGIAKAGFVASMLGYDVGCLDSRNLTRYAIAPRLFRADVGAKTLTRNIAAYVEICRELGGASGLWDTWCQDYAMGLGLFYSPRDVSTWHLAAIENLPRLALPVPDVGGRMVAA